MLETISRIFPQNMSFIRLELVCFCEICQVPCTSGHLKNRSSGIEDLSPIEDLTMTESEIEEHSRENDQFRPRLFENDYFEYNAGAIFRGDSRKKFIVFLA